jgi:hypothetical protein
VNPGRQLLEDLLVFADEPVERRAPRREGDLVDEGKRRDRTVVQEMARSAAAPPVSCATIAGRSRSQKSSNAARRRPCAASETSCPARLSEAPKPRRSKT